MKYVLFEHKEIKLGYKLYFVENKAVCAACLKNAVSFLAA
jgi:hypothetical protein